MTRMLRALTRAFAGNQRIQRMYTDLLDDYQAHQRQVLRHSERTISNYLSEVADFLRFLGSKDRSHPAVVEKLKAVNTPLLLAFLSRPTTAQNTTIGPVTFNLRLAAVRSLYAYLVRIEALEGNPALRVARQRVRERERQPLTFAELIRLIDSVRDNSPPQYRARNVAIVQVLIHTALRVHEVCGLNVEQFDPEHNLLVGVKRKGDKHLAATLNDVVTEALLANMAARPSFQGSETESAMFLSDRGQRIAVRTVQELVRFHGAKAGIRHVSPHILRHSSATQLAALGTPLNVIQDICAHSSISTTQRYLHSQDTDRKRAVDALAREWRRQVGLTAAAE